MRVVGLVSIEQSLVVKSRATIGRVFDSREKRLRGVADYTLTRRALVLGETASSSMDERHLLVTPAFGQSLQLTTKVRP